MIDALPSQAGASRFSRAPTAGELRRDGWRGFSLRGLLIALILVIVSTAFVFELPNGDLVEAVLLSAAFLFAVMAIGVRRRTFVIALLLAIPALAGKWINHFQPDAAPASLFLGAGIAFGAFVVGQLLAFVLRARRVTIEVLCAGVSGYLMMAILWTMAYLLVARVVPQAFAYPGSDARPFVAFDALYFSLITLNTIGYGDITPLSNAARILAMIEGTVGIMYLGTVLARLVSLYSAPPPWSDPAE